MRVEIREVDIGTTNSIIQAGESALGICAFRVQRTSTSLADKKLQHTNATELIPFIIQHLLTRTTLTSPLDAKWFQISYTDKSQTFILVSKVPAIAS